MTILPIATGRGQNDREHYMARARRVAKEKEAVAWSLKMMQRPALPCVVVLTRRAPSGGLDDDNLVGALKGVRDAVAEWLGVDDGDVRRIRFKYAQERAPWSVRIEFAPPVKGMQGELELQHAE